MLPELIISERSEDLVEVPIQVYDFNNNNLFDKEDFILWFAKDPTSIRYKESNQSYDAQGHDFDIASHYFLTWGGNAGKRITTIADGRGLSYNQTTNQYVM